MKKLLFFVVVATLAFSNVQSQEVRLGAKGGVNFSFIGGEDTGDFKALTGFHIGALVEIPINEKFAVQPEVLYSTQGAKEEYSIIPNGGFGIKYDTKLKLDYITIPIMAKYYVIDGLSLEAGPQFGILVSAQSEGEATALEPNGTQESISFDTDVKDSFKSFDLGLGIGAGYRLNNGVFFSARYIIGLNDISEDIRYNGTADFESYTRKNNVIQLSAGYSF